MRFRIDIAAEIVPADVARGPGLRLALGSRSVELRAGRTANAVLTEFGTSVGNRSGLVQTRELRLPAGMTVRYRRQLRTYGQAVGSRFTDPAFNWVIDEFDDSFNDLAIASLRYHQDWAITRCDEERRATYQDLIDRLGKSAPEPTDAESAVLRGGWPARREPLPGGRVRIHPPSDAERAVRDAIRARESEWIARQDQARHDFLDVMRELWS